MTWPPDLSDPAQRDAYRRELRGVARKTRYVGLLLAVTGLGLAYASRSAADPALLRLAAILTIAAGFGLMIFGIMRRTLHHRMRMAPPDKD